MKLQNLCKTHVVLQSDNYTIFFSYGVPCAIFLPKSGLFFAANRQNKENKWSKTTQRHVNNSWDFCLGMEKEWSKEYPQISSDAGIAAKVLDHDAFSKMMRDIETGGALCLFDLATVEKVLGDWNDILGEQL